MSRERKDGERLDVEIPMLESQGDPNDLRASLGERDRRGGGGGFNRTEFNLSHNSSDTHMRIHVREKSGRNEEMRFLAKSRLSKQPLRGRLDLFSRLMHG